MLMRLLGVRSRTLAARLREESGFSIIEGTVAALLLVIGSLAVLAALDVGTRNTARAEQSQVVSNRLQAELEEIRSIPFQELAIAPEAVPAASSDPSEPTYRLGQGVDGPTFALDRSGSADRPVVTAGGGLLDPGPEPFQSGDVSGVIYRFATWTNSGDVDMKRVIVAIQLNSTAAALSRSYQEVHTDLVDPEATPANNSLPSESGNPDAPGQLFLTDTSCDFAAPELAGPNHQTSNTRGRCEDGPSTSSARGAPDLMANQSPGAVQEEYSYSSELSASGGLTMRPISPSSCSLSYHKVDVNGTLYDGPLDLDLDSAAGDHQKLHKWVSPPIPAGSSLRLTGDGTLKLWTRSVNGASHPGTICAWLFTRKPGEVLGLPIDLPILEQPKLLACPDSGQCSGGWPQQWTEISVPLGPFTPKELVAGERLGLAITVAGTSENNVQFHFDHTSFDSRVELPSEAPLPF